MVVVSVATNKVISNNKYVEILTKELAILVVIANLSMNNTSKDQINNKEEISKVGIIK